MSVDRRKFIGLMSSGIAAASAGSLPASAQSTSLHKTSKANRKRPNFLFMIADDMTYRTIGSLSNPEVHTPNLDRLASRGCAFTHCFQQGSWAPAVCFASRTMLNSGLSAFRAMNAARRLSSFQPNDIEDMQSVLLPAALGALDNNELELSLDDYPAWGQTLGMAGYNTYLCGKWHLDCPMLQRSFMEQGPVGPGMYRSTGIKGSAYMRPSPGNHWDPANRALNGHWVHTDLVGNTVPDRVLHSSELYANHCVDYIHKAAQREEPFFMYMGWNAPHDPRQAPQEFLDMYPVDKVGVPPNFLPEHPFNEGDHHVRDEQLAPWPRTKEAIQLHRREYYAIISHMDQQIGRLFDALEQTGQLDNTYIIMTADHGLAIGEHGLVGKQNVYDCSIRVPLIIAGPQIPKGKRIDELVYQHSMFATTCELAGAPLPKHVEFPSLVPLMTAKGGPLHDAVFSYYKDFQRTARTKTHKIIVYPQIQKVQLFDIVKDPWEMHDLSADPTMVPVKNQLMERLKRFQAELGDKLNLDQPKSLAHGS